MYSFSWISLCSILIGRINYGSAIAYGSVAEIGTYKHMAFINNLGGGFCGGAVLDASHILTAAHCVHQSDITNLRVYAGAVDLRSSLCQQREVRTKHVHKNYRPPDGEKIQALIAANLMPRYWKYVAIKDDIAVLTLSAPLDLAFNVMPVVLPNVATTLSTQHAFFAGWGVNENNEMGYDLKFMLVIALKPKLSKKLQLSSRKNQFDVVTINGQSYATQGDSGSPLVINDRVYGILSTGSLRQDGSCVFTKVHPYIDFIKAAMED